MPLTRLRDDYLTRRRSVLDGANRVQLSGTDGAVFEAYRELIEELASAAYDAEAPFDDHGRVLVSSEAIARITRSA